MSTLCIIFGFIILAVGLIGLGISLENDEYAPTILSLILSTIGLILFAAGNYCNGEEQGAYNQLKGKYEITYVIDKDSCVVDTIINFK